MTGVSASVFFFYICYLLFRNVNIITSDFDILRFRNSGNRFKYNISCEGRTECKPPLVTAAADVGNKI